MDLNEAMQNCGDAETLRDIVKEFRTVIAEKADLIESVSAAVIRELESQKLTGASCGDLEQHAYSVNDSIGDPQIRNLHVLAGV